MPSALAATAAKSLSTLQINNTAALSHCADIYRVHYELLPPVIRRVESDLVTIMYAYLVLVLLINYRFISDAYNNGAKISDT